MELKDLKRGQRINITLTGYVADQELNHTSIRFDKVNDGVAPNWHCNRLHHDNKVEITVELPPPAVGDVLIYSDVKYEILAIVDGYWVCRRTTRGVVHPCPAICRPDSFDQYTRHPKQEAS